MDFTNLWINKYKPKCINDIYGNIEEIAHINNWISNYNKNKNKALIISGNKGNGKTLMIKLILEALGYIIKIIYPNNIKKIRNNNDFLDYNNFVNSIYAKVNFENYSNKKIAIIFNEIENINLASDKKFILDIYKENNKNKSFPLFFISNNYHSKLLFELKKNCTEIIIKNLSYDDYYKLINKISINEQIQFESHELINKLIIYSQFDIRRLINLFQEISIHVDENKLITSDIINMFLKSSREKNINIGLFNATKTILNNNLNYENIMELYEIEKVLQPLMIHENYYKRLLSNNSNNLKNTLDNLSKISDLLSIGDNIETSIYTDQNWYLQKIHGFYTCIFVSYIINKFNNSYQLKCNNINFSSDLNKTSLKNINKKNINNLIKIIENKTNLEILMLNKLCNHLINTNNENILLNKLRKYDNNIDRKDIELCLKIDKSNDFNILTLKKKISKFIN